MITDDNNRMEESAKELLAEGKTLDEIIRNAEFPDDYEAFDDEMLDMIP